MCDDPPTIGRQPPDLHHIRLHGLDRRDLAGEVGIAGVERLFGDDVHALALQTAFQHRGRGAAVRLVTGQQRDRFGSQRDGDEIDHIRNDGLHGHGGPAEHILAERLQHAAIRREADEIGYWPGAQPGQHGDRRAAGTPVPQQQHVVARGQALHRGNGAIRG